MVVGGLVVAGGLVLAGGLVVVTASGVATVVGGAVLVGGCVVGGLLVVAGATVVAPVVVARAMVVPPLTTTTIVGGEAVVAVVTTGLEVMAVVVPEVPRAVARVVSGLSVVAVRFVAAGRVDVVVPRVVDAPALLGDDSDVEVPTSAPRILPPVADPVGVVAIGRVVAVGLVTMVDGAATEESAARRAAPGATTARAGEDFVGAGAGATVSAGGTTLRRTGAPGVADRSEVTETRMVAAGVTLGAGTSGIGSRALTSAVPAPPVSPSARANERAALPAPCRSIVGRGTPVSATATTVSLVCSRAGKSSTATPATLR